MFTRTTILALAALATFASIGLAPTSASAGWWDRYQDRKDIRHDYTEFRHDLYTGHYGAAWNELKDIRQDRRDLFWDHF
jgi:hypothetical protein